MAIPKDDEMTFPILPILETVQTSRNVTSCGSARAKIKVLLKRILSEHGFPK